MESSLTPLKILIFKVIFAKFHISSRLFGKEDGGID